MIRELQFDPRNVAALRDEIYGLRDSEECLVLRGAARQHDRDQWVRFLMEDWRLEPDTRHFDPAWAAEYARKHKIVAHAAVGAVEEGFDTNQQVAPAYWWEVSYQPDRASAYSYSNTRQPMHTDSAWFEDASEVNFFIMQKQAASGGEQVFYPLSRIVEDLANEEPALYRDATSVEVTIKKGEGDFQNRTTILRTGADPRVSWNYYRTEKPTAEVKAMCDALFAWFEKKESTPSVSRLRAQTGDCFVFNDSRMIHGRSAFAASKAFDRILLQSMWRVPRGA